MEHPLAHAVDRIDPAVLYRSDDLAELLGLARSSVNTLALSGWFPGFTWEREPNVGGRQRVWTGAALIAAADTEPPALDHSRYAPSTLWRLGCGCDSCLAWHNADSRTRRRTAADAAFPEQQRQEVLDLISAGAVATIEEAAVKAEVTRGRCTGSPAATTTSGPRSTKPPSRCASAASGAADRAATGRAAGEPHAGERTVRSGDQRPTF
ncbi:hypothetical protein ABZ599_15565 [Streptomyces misionensis]|uniref:hypothetical protein n=1 Tax=Streptomyces misionensis TaxID=67331 RepID=UPI0033E44D9A